MLSDEAEPPRQPATRSNLFKLGLIGNPHSGKTTFAKQFCDGYFSEKYTPHVSLEAYRGRTETGLNVMLYEIPGQSQYIELYDVSALRLSGLIFVYSDSIEATYSRLEYLITFSQKYALDGLPGLLLCNTTPEKGVHGRRFNGRSLATQFGFQFMEMDLRFDRDRVHAAVQLFLS